jgi:hypothetical protein
MRVIAGVAIMFCGAVVFIATSERHAPPIPSGILFAVGALTVATQVKEIALNLGFFRREMERGSNRDCRGIMATQSTSA